MLSCFPVHKNEQEVKINAKEIQKFKPNYTVALYNTKVDVVGNHFSGLLLIKKMPDSTTRIVFSNEIGFKFFDFEFNNDFDFKVYSVIKQMNRKAVITTLRTDFELVLMQMNLNTSGSRYTQNGRLYNLFPDLSGKGYNCYITDMLGDTLLGMERRSNNKTIVNATMRNYNEGQPDTISIVHNRFNFSIGLKRINQ
jgi:hypothetical protein